MKKEKEKESKSSKQQAASPASQQYICQYKIQPIVPNTFSNKESIAQEDSLHNLLEKVYFLYSIVWGGGLLITFPHYSAPPFRPDNTDLDVFREVVLRNGSA